MIKKYIKMSFIGKFFHEKKIYKTPNNYKMHPRKHENGQDFICKNNILAILCCMLFSHAVTSTAQKGHDAKRTLTFNLKESL